MRGCYAISLIAAICNGLALEDGNATGSAPRQSGLICAILDKISSKSR